MTRVKRSVNARKKRRATLERAKGFRGEAHSSYKRAKEAMMKALGTGVRGIAWREIELLPDRRGKPLVYLHGKAAERAKLLGLGQPEVSMTHSDTMALAFVVATCETEIDLDDAKSALVERLARRGWL